MGRVDSLKICGECGAHCCFYGGTAATKEEVDKIVKAGFKNKFEKLSENAYFTKWTKNGVCPYLKNNACSIHQVRPVICRAFPASFTIENNKRAYYLHKCPLENHLPKKVISDGFKMLKNIPDDVMLKANDYLKPHYYQILKRIHRFKLVKLEK